MKEFLPAALAVALVWAVLAALGYLSPAVGAAIAFVAAAGMVWRERRAAPLRRWNILAESSRDAQLHGLYCVAESRAREALQAASLLRSDQERHQAESALLLATALNTQKKFAEAEQALRAVPGEGSRLFAQLAHSLAGQTKLPEAEQAAFRAQQDAGENPNDLDRAAILDALANIRSRQGRMNEALEHLSEWVKILERSTDPKIRESAGPARIRLGATYTRARKGDKAAHVLEDCARQSASRKGQLYDATEALSHLCAALSQEGRPDEAIVAGRRAETLRATLLTPGDPLHGQVWVNLAIACAEAGKPRDAFEYIERASSLKGPLSASETAFLNFARGLANESSGNYNEAESIYRQTLAEVARIHGGSHPVLVDSLVALSRVLRRDNRDEEAAEFEAMQDRIEEAMNSNA